MALPGTDGAGHMEAFYEFARRAYGDLHEPNYAFVAEALDRDPYRQTIRDITRTAAHVSDLANWNDDVAYCYRIDLAGEPWCVWLSVVAPYAAMHRAGEDVAVADFINPAMGIPDATAPVLGILRNAGFDILGPDQLALPMDFVPVNGEGPVSLFRVFFSDTGDLPWPD